jgi:hypothetical protein
MADGRANRRDAALVAQYIHELSERHGSGGAQRGSRHGRREIRGRLGGGQRRLAGAAQLGVELTGGQAAGEEGGERSLLSLGQPTR